MCKTKTNPFPPLGGYSCRNEPQNPKEVTERVFVGGSFRLETKIVPVPPKKICGHRSVPVSHYAPDLSLFCEEMETRQKCLKNSNCDWKRVETVSGKAAKCVDSE